jgi:hypothetical protein
LFKRKRSDSHLAVPPSGRSGAFGRPGIEHFLLLLFTNKNIPCDRAERLLRLQMPLTPKSQQHVKDESVELQEDSRPSSASGLQQESCEEIQHDASADQVEKQLDARSAITIESILPPPPDGGLHAWLKVFGGFLIYINIWSAYPTSKHTFLTNSGDSHCPTAHFKPTTSPIYSHPRRHQQSPGSGLCKHGS